MRAERFGADRLGRIIVLIAAVLIIGSTHAFAGENIRLAQRPTDTPGAAAASPEAYAPKAHIVSLGLWGLQNLFRTEANQAAAVLHAYYGRGGTVMVKANTPTMAVVTMGFLRTQANATWTTVKPRGAASSSRRRRTRPTLWRKFSPPRIG